MTGALPSDCFISYFSAVIQSVFYSPDVLENFECESNSDNDVDHGDLNEMSTGIDICNDDSDEDFKANNNRTVSMSKHRYIF